MIVRYCLRLIFAAVPQAQQACKFVLSQSEALRS